MRFYILLRFVTKVQPGGDLLFRRVKFTRYLDLMGYSGLLGHLGLLSHLDFLGHLGLLDILDHLAHMGNLALYRVFCVILLDTIQLWVV